MTESLCSSFNLFVINRCMEKSSALHALVRAVGERDRVQPDFHSVAFTGAFKCL